MTSYVQILEKSVRILFDSMDISKVKHYVQYQLIKLFSDRVSLSDYTIAKEFRGMGKYRPGACVPSLKLAKYVTSDGFCGQCGIALLYHMCISLQAVCGCR